MLIFVSIENGVRKRGGYDMRKHASTERQAIIMVKIKEYRVGYICAWP